MTRKTIITKVQRMPGVYERQVYFEYSEDATNSQRGFTPAGSPKNYFRPVVDVSQQPKLNSRQKRKLEQVGNWGNSIFGSWQNWKWQMYMQGKSLKTK